MGTVVLKKVARDACDDARMTSVKTVLKRVAVTDICQYKDEKPIRV